LVATDREQWVAALAAAAPNARAAAALEIGKRVHPDNVRPLVAALRVEDDLNVREMLTWALVKHGAMAIDALTALYADADAGQRHEAVHVLGKIGGAGVLPALIAALADDAVRVRRKAALSLGVIGDPRAIDGLIASLRDPDDELRNTAATALDQIGVAAVDPLCSVACDEHAPVIARLAAIEVLGGLGESRAIAPLAELLRGLQRDVRLAAVLALVTIGGAEARAALMLAADDPDQRIRRAAAQAASRDP
jgi:HEAT repeat protein